MKKKPVSGTAQHWLPWPDMFASPKTTQLLLRACDGDESSVAVLMTRVYGELHTLAEAYMCRERPGHTLQPTALAHEAYLKLVDQRNTDWKSRAHFFAIASELIRRILVDHARKKLALRRGGDRGRESLEADMVVDAGREEVDLMALDDALMELGRLNERQRRVVELRFFGGLTIEETASVLEIGTATVTTDWKFARAWLRSRLESDE